MEKWGSYIQPHQHKPEMPVVTGHIAWGTASQHEFLYAPKLSLMLLKHAWNPKICQESHEGHDIWPGMYVSTWHSDKWIVPRLLRGAGAKVALQYHRDAVAKGKQPIKEDTFEKVAARPAKRMKLSNGISTTQPIAPVLAAPPTTDPPPIVLTPPIAAGSIVYCKTEQGIAFKGVVTGRDNRSAEVKATPPPPPPPPTTM
jgi:hypothetical protein